MKNYVVIALLLGLFGQVHGQDEELQNKRGFKKENLFTGGSISLGFGNYSFQAGASPMLGYNLAPWIDAGVTVNYNYASYRNVYVSDPNDKLRSTTYGAGAFTRVYPISMGFLQAQYEHNFVTQKLIPGNGQAYSKNSRQANSLLLGLGYASGRYPGSGQPFVYFSLLFDVLRDSFSPYVSNTGNILPILRGGVQVPLFQGKRRAPRY